MFSTSIEIKRAHLSPYHILEYFLQISNAIYKFIIDSVESTNNTA